MLLYYDCLTVDRSRLAIPSKGCDNGLLQRVLQLVQGKQADFCFTRQVGFSQGRDVIKKQKYKRGTHCPRIAFVLVE